MAPLTNKEGLIAKAGKHVANQIEFRVQELCKLAESIDAELIIDYKPRNAATFAIVVKHDPAQEPELPLQPKLPKCYEGFVCQNCTQSEGNHVGDQCLCSHDGKFHNLNDKACVWYTEYVSERYK